VDLRGTKVAEKPVLAWTATAPWTVSGYTLLRSTSPVGLRQTRPYALLPAGTITYTDTAATAPLLFYEVVPTSIYFSLEWPGPYMVPVDPDLSDDGFKPTPVEPYLGAPEDVALSGDASEFWVDARSLLGCVPTAVELLVDRNDDGDYDDPGEIVPMTRFTPVPPASQDSLYFARLDQPAGKGTPPEPDTALYARDAAGQTRWAKADGTGTITYRFRAWDGSAYAGGPASAGGTLILLNTAPELLDDLGKPVVAAGACSRGTDWQTALVYFEEAEGLVSPTSPFNQASDPNRNEYYLQALLASAIAETGYTLAHYQTLFESPGSKPYRDTMLDWKLFADEQVDRMDYLSQWAPSEPDTPWDFQFPKFCIWLEETMRAPFLNALSAVGGGPYGTPFGIPLANPALPASPLLDLARATTPKPAQGRAEADEPVYTFEAARWDRTDAHMLASLFYGWRAAAIAYRVYENPSAARVVTCGDLGDISVWLEPENDAKDHAECNTTPCPPLNGIDDDGDDLIDDLGYAARVFETFDGIGVYSPDSGNGLTLEDATDDASEASSHLRQALRCVLKESHIQDTDATLVYGDGGEHPPSFLDEKSYNGLLENGAPCPGAPAPCPDGLPDLDYASGGFLPVPWCPPAAPGDPEPPLYLTPLTIRGGLGDDIDWWIKKTVEAYNEFTGENLDEACYPQAWLDTLYAADWGYTLERAVADTTPHYTLNFRDDIEQFLADHDVDPADLGPDFETFLEFAEDIDVRMFIESPEDLRNYVPRYCPAHTAPPCTKAKNYSFNGFWGDWDEAADPIVPDKFWTIEPFSVFSQGADGILLASCDPSNLNTDPGCIQINWDDLNGNGEYDLFEPINMLDPSTPGHAGQPMFIDLNGDGQWNGWTDDLHEKALYAGEQLHPGSGLYNGLYVYWTDPTFGGRLPGVTNESLNNYIGAAAGWADGLLEFPSDNHPPSNYHMTEGTPTVSGANLRLVITATDADGDTLHYHMVLPSSWSGAEVLLDGKDSGVFELAVPDGDWGLIGIAYDNVNNLNDAAGMYLVVSR
jgi:hypothetical protein